MDVGQKIRVYLEDRRISQIELCKRTNISPSKLNLSLSGKRRFTFPEYQAICWALGVGVDMFLEPCPMKKPQRSSDRCTRQSFNDDAMSV